MLLMGCMRRGGFKVTANPGNEQANGVLIWSACELIVRFFLLQSDVGSGMNVATL